MDPISHMDEDIPPENEHLSYADDVPYEAQMSDTMEQEKSVSLRKRIGNRIYPIEDSMSKKRKLADVKYNEELEIVGGDADSPYRPNAILLQGPPITQIPTARVFAYATHFDAHPIGLEWVDDQTCVLIFTSRQGAMQAWGALCRTPLPVNTLSDDSGTSTPIEVEDPKEGFSSAQPLPLALYPIEERINSVLGHQKTNALKQAIRMRWARITDVKEPGAMMKSEFYKRHGEQAGKEGRLLFRSSTAHEGATNGNKRRRRNDDEMRRQLDAELDVFLVEDEGASSMPLDDLPPAGTRSNQSRRSEDRMQMEEEKRRILDYQLDSFLANGNVPDATMDPAGSNNTTTSQGPSLVERTARTDTSRRSRSPKDRSRHVKRLPRRGRRKGPDDSESMYRTDVNGRWLHNAEIRSNRMRRDNYDDGGFGMRAWSNERQTWQQPKIRKAHEELDRELDQLSKGTD